MNWVKPSGWGGRARAVRRHSAVRAIAAMTLSVVAISHCARAQTTDAAWHEMVAAEELIHALGPALGALSRSMEHGALPDRTTVSLFAERVDVLALEAPESPKRLDGRGLWRYPVPSAAEVRTIDRSVLRLWQPVLGHFGDLEHVSLRVERGRFSDESRERFVVDLLFDAGARRDGRRVALHGSVATQWVRRATASGAGAEWRIARWENRGISVLESHQLLFEEALDQVIADPVLRHSLRRSRHEELAVAKLREPATFTNPHRHFFVGSQDRHPGVAVADVNGDGTDDIYVMARWGANRLLVGSADGTFRDAAPALGLAIEDHSSSAIFADFDNDGDPDLYLGRTMVPSMYFENRAGRFVDRSASMPPGALPALVSSVSAVDVNNDGLLDIYVSTYAAQMLVFDLKLFQARNPGEVAPARLLADFLSAASASELSRRVRTEGAHLYMSLPGPPNVLLLNHGTGFGVAAESALATYGNTYQATWADYDRDGDTDVYLAQDFAPNRLLRNDGEAGFTDVTRETGTADVGFGMGVTWGDYDGDGRQDLYVSNMYSKAGVRVISYFDEIDGRLAKMARGNTLFRNTGGGFAHVSGPRPPQLPVENAGWSWSGQFADFDNDTHLDLYAASGYYTAPRDVAVAVDT